PARARAARRCCGARRIPPTSAATRRAQASPARRASSAATRWPTSSCRTDRAALALRLVDGRRRGLIELLLQQPALLLVAQGGLRRAGAEREWRALPDQRGHRDHERHHDQLAREIRQERASE